MNIQPYLDRIHCKETLRPDYQTLVSLFESHLFAVPFENIDIHFKKQFGLELDRVYQKVVENGRGGFCYELNYLFNQLLQEIGFSTKMISAGIVKDDGSIGPPLDHLLVYVHIDQPYIVDVGFGDLFFKPLALSEKRVQFDGRNYFKLEKDHLGSYTLMMSADKIEFQKKYVFTLAERHIHEFREICLDKQSNPESYFVKNTVCTKPTELGRLTVFNRKLIEKKGGDIRIMDIENDEHLIKVLRERFNMEVL
jgi:N-hydroxyarylamine O-acetyltransferase